MAIGLIGRKVGMTRIFTEDGTSIPVTVIEATPNRVTQLRTEETDGYRALQVTVGTKKANRVNKAEAGHFAKAGVEAGRTLAEFRLEDNEGADIEVGGEITVEAGRTLAEFRLEDNEGADIEVGGEITVEIFNDTKKIDVTGTSKGKGFQGAIKRWNFSSQRMTHGNSLSHRAPGSIGQNQSPGKVFKGKKMAGQLGNKQVTTQSLEVVRVDLENSLILVKGAVPGATGSDVIVKPAVKA